MIKLLAAAAALVSLAVPVTIAPELGSWALILSGFGGMVTMLGRRPQAVVRIRFA